MVVVVGHNYIIIFHVLTKCQFEGNILNTQFIHINFVATVEGNCLFILKC